MSASRPLTDVLQQAVARLVGYTGTVNAWGDTTVEGDCSCCDETRVVAELFCVNEPPGRFAQALALLASWGATRQPTQVQVRS